MFADISFIVFLYTGSADRARQMIISILHHISNQHEFASLTLFPKCAHGPIEVEKAWINSGLVLVYLNWILLFYLSSRLSSYGKTEKGHHGEKGPQSR